MVVGVEEEEEEEEEVMGCVCGVFVVVVVVGGCVCERGVRGCRLRLDTAEEAIGRARFFGADTPRVLRLADWEYRGEVEEGVRGVWMGVTGVEVGVCGCVWSVFILSVLS